MLVLKDTVFLMRIGFLNAASNLTLNCLFVFVFHFGVEGIALSTVVTSWMLFILFVAALRRRLGEIPLKLPVRELGQSLGIILILSIISKWVWWLGHLHYERWISLTLSTLFFFLSYLLFLHALKIETYFQLRKLLLRR
jgi:peptidoglycan biosynthesis protein MviN/MurJ (putative lipid II flippase)